MQQFLSLTLDGQLSGHRRTSESLKGLLSIHQLKCFIVTIPSTVLPINRKPPTIINYFNKIFSISYAIRTNTSMLQLVICYHLSKFFTQYVLRCTCQEVQKTWGTGPGSWSPDYQAIHILNNQQYLV